MFIFSFEFHRLILLNDILVQRCVLIFLDKNIFILINILSFWFHSFILDNLFMWNWNAHFYFIWVSNIKPFSFFLWSLLILCIVCLIYRHCGISSWAASHNFGHYFLSKLFLWHLLNLPWWVSLFYRFNNRLHLFRWKGWASRFTRFIGFL